MDLYAPKLNGPGGFATVHLRVRCCEPGGSVATLGRSVSAPNVTVRNVDDVEYFVECRGPRGGGGTNFLAWP